MKNNNSVHDYVFYFLIAAILLLIPTIYLIVDSTSPTVDTVEIQNHNDSWDELNRLMLWQMSN